MTESEQELLEEVAATAVAIINLTDDKTISELAAFIADKLISLTKVQDL